MLWFACVSQPNPEQGSELVEETELQGLVAMIDDLTKAMDSSYEPSLALSKLRETVAQNGARYRLEVAKLNDKILTFESSERELFRGRARFAIEGSLDRFAVAQQRLREKMDESQKVELSEVLMTLK